MYVKHYKLSRNKKLELMKYFVGGSTARTTAELVGVRNTVVRFFHKLRTRAIADLVVFEKGNEVEELLAKWQCLVF